MPDVIALLTIYYICASDAAIGALSQEERFACNATYQAAKRGFLRPEEQSAPSGRLTAKENILAYQRFKSWEAANMDLVAALKARGAH